MNKGKKNFKASDGKRFMKYKEIPETKPEPRLIVRDFREFDDLINDIANVLQDFDVHVMDHPDFEGSDSYGLVFANEPMTPEMIVKTFGNMDSNPIAEKADNDDFTVKEMTKIVKAFPTIALSKEFVNWAIEHQHELVHGE